MVATVALVALVVVVVVVASARRTDRVLTEAGVRTATSAVPTTPSPSPTPDPGGCGHLATTSSADLDGDGCADPYAIEGTTVRALGRTYQVGRAGDHVQVGDWDCDGLATAGVVRPSTGEVFLFDGWHLVDGAVTVRAVDVVAGARRLQPGSGTACVPIVVADDGERTPLDLRRAER